MESMGYMPQVKQEKIGFSISTEKRTAKKEDKDRLLGMNSKRD